MKNKFFFSLLFLFFAFLILNFNDISARGGRGGGGAIGSGAARSGGMGHSIQRSPSMSRARAPTASSIGSPAAATTRSNLSSPAALRTQGNTGARNQVQQFVRDNPGQVRSQMQNQVESQVQGNFSAGRLNQGTLGNSIRSEINSNYPNRGSWFNNSFFDNHGFRPSYYGTGGNWWAGAGAWGLGPWLGWDETPYYYDYNENAFGITEGQPVPQATSQEIAQNTSTATNSNWMSLGVFALVKNNQNAVSSHIFFQLALDKKGDISGTVYNSKTDKSYGIEGIANQKRQSATWKMSNSENSPFIETGLYNLTADQAPARIYYANGMKEDVLLVRINQL